DALARHDLAERRVFQLHALDAVLALNEGASDVTVANQTFDRGYAEFEGHRVGRGLAGVGNGDDDGVFVQRYFAEPLLLVGQFSAQGGAGQVDAAFIQRAGDIGEV